MNKLHTRMAQAGIYIGLTKNTKIKQATNVFVEPSINIGGKPAKDMPPQSEKDAKRCRRKLRILRKKVAKHNNKHRGTKCAIESE